MSKNLNVLGFLNINTQKLFASCTYDKVDTDVVIEYFNLFTNKIKKETVAVIDNASIHISKIFYLPPSSPQLNPIEILWKFMKYYRIEFDAYKFG